MNKNKKRFLSIIFLLTMVTSFLTVPVQAASGNEGLRDSKPVRIACGMNGSLYFDESGEPTGLALPLIRQIAWNAGWKLEYVEGTYSESLQKLGDGEIDLMFSVGKAEDPEGKLLYSNFDGGIQQIGLFAREDADLYYEDFANFDGKRVGLSSGGNSIALEAYEKEHDFFCEQVTNYNGVQEKIDALINGECVGIYVDTIKEIAKQSGLTIEIVPVEDDSKLYSYLDDGTVDFVMSLFDLRFHAENADNYLISNGISEYVTVAVTDANYQFEKDDSLSVA